MKKTKHDVVAAIGAIALTAGTGALAQSPAANWPSRPLRIISGFAPGGATDIAARAAAQKLTESLGQSVVVENRPGAAGNIAAEMVARGAPDGYSIYLANATMATPSLFAKVPFDINRDFAFISMIGMGPSALVLHPSVPARSVKELIALAKMHPHKLNYASGGTGNITHLAMELLISMTALDMVHVPYKGGAPSTIATVSGEAQLMFSSIASTLAQIQQGRLRAIAVSSMKRSVTLPQVPTVHEAGVRGYDASSWYGLVMAAATPPPIVSRLSGDMMKALTSADMKERLASQGIEPVAGGTDEFRKYISAEIPKWAKVIRDAKIPPQ
ncbi:MAG: tripartite tricarboxylate transporter substrate binding protein [Burkholderiales bacterium]